MLNAKRLNPDSIRIVMIVDAIPSDSKLAEDNTLKAFSDAGLTLKNTKDFAMYGIYLTQVVTEQRKGLVLPKEKIQKYLPALEKELLLFPNIVAILLMGNAAIYALNEIVKLRGDKRLIPAGSTYKIRNEKYYWGKIRVFPSYLHTGKNFLIEKAKQRMVVQDIQEALKL